MPFRREKVKNSELFYQLDFTLPVNKEEHKASSPEMSSLTSAYTAKSST